MNRFLSRLTFNSEGGGGGAAAAAAATPAEGGAAAAAAAGGAAAAAPAPSGGAATPAGGVTPSAGNLYRPDGLGENFIGASNNETIDKLRAAVDGYRQRDATQQIPETKDAYGAFAGDIPDAIKPHLDTLKGDPLFDRVAEKALALRVPVNVYQGLVQEMLSVSQEMGIMEPVVDEKAERAALVPEAAKHLPEPERKAAVERRMNENFAFVDALVERGADKGGLSKDDAEFAKAMLGDSAKGHRFFEMMRGMAGGGSGNGPSLSSGQTGDLDPKAEISRRAALPQNTWGHKDFDRKSYDQLQADRRRVYGD